MPLMQKQPNDMPLEQIDINAATSHFQQATKEVLYHTTGSLSSCGYQDVCGRLLLPVHNVLCLNLTFEVNKSS